MRLSLIICSFNRSGFLKKCLDSLLPQLNEEIEIIVIDNNSSDDTAQVVSRYTENYKNIHYIIEPEVGLSHARNRGINESKEDWILYLDDDVIAFPNLVERALYLVKRGGFDCIGGNYIGYTENYRPKWLPDHFESYAGSITQLSQCSYTIPFGCNVIYRKQALVAVGLFDPTFGMKGEKMGYGDETELQLRLQNHGFRIGFDPQLKVYHTIREDKLQLRWHLKSVFQKGYYINRAEKSTNLVILIGYCIKSFLGLLVIRIPITFYRLATKKNYYWQNMVYDSIMPNMIFLGKLVSALKIKL